MIADLISHPIVAMALMIGGLVLFHELGHFLVGRWCGIAVEAFSIGFGGTIISKKIGQTTYQVSWLPLGGFVKFYGSSRNEDVPEGVTGQLFYTAPLWKRALIISAGPAANFLLAFLILWGMVMNGMEVQPPAIGDVIEGSRAQQAGILPGDYFVRIDGKDIRSWSDIERAISRHPEKALNVEVDRDGKRVALSLVPEAVEGSTLFGTKAKIGRAGVALGYPSAVVTVLDSSSPLGQLGIQTGDRIESYRDSNGSMVPIKGFHHFLQLLKQWKQSGVSQVEWSVQKMNVSVNKSGKQQEEKMGSARSVLVPVHMWPGIDGSTDRAFAKILGVVDSHLTVATSQGETAKSLLPGDHLLAWNDTPIRNVFHLQEIMYGNTAPTAKISVLRNGKSADFTVNLKGTEVQKAEGNVTIYTPEITMLGLSTLPEPAIIQVKNPVKAAWFALEEGYTQTAMMLSSFWAIISGQLPLKALGGPIMIAKVASDSAKAGISAFLATMAIISINLAIVNLFPIPVLDGGQLMMLAAERFKGAPLGEQTIENFHKLGFVLVLCMIVLAMYNDLSRYWASMIGSVMGTMR